MNKKAIFINESNFYKLVFQSRKPQAEEFTDWVVSDVLPTIRKTGGYVNNDDMFIENYLPFADETTKMLFKSTLETVRKQNELIKEQKTKIGVMQPKADYFDELVDRKLLTNFRDTAKELKIKEKEFISFLINNKFVYRDSKGKIKPYADKNNGLFEIKECYGQNNKWVGNQTLITPKGKETFRLLLKI